nr:PREDICTED: BTB/POZ domain-containing protein 7 [Bemisia tabaci]
MNFYRALIPCAVERSDEHMTQRMGVTVSSSSCDIPSNYGPGITCSNTSERLAGPVRERKKLKMAGFATLRKKFIRRRRSSKACDHSRVIRDLISDWTRLEVIALIEEYEALAALKDLSMQAELARPPAATFKQDLSMLYDYKYCTDIDLIYQGVCFPVHRAILSARCPYFRDLLVECPGYEARIRLDLRTPGIDVEMFSALLRYLYTGDLIPTDGDRDLVFLQRLRDELGTPNSLENDLRYLLETGDYADAALVFTSDNSDFHRPDSGSSEYGFRPKLEFPCHKAILSARSPFFRNLIQRRTRSGEERTERALHIPTRIVLDKSVIPKRYARVLLHAIYLDTVDLSLIRCGSNCDTSARSLHEVEALTHTGRTRPSPLEEAMELYQIGRFLDLDIVAQGCEDLILEWLTIHSLPGVLRWSSQPHGSAWVYRQAKHFLREEFSQISNSPVLHQLEKSHLIDVLQSDFLQASELEVLEAVLKWGEQQLVRRMEDREPNLVSQTAHSVSRKGIKKRDLNDVELREILSELLPHVRMDHVIPTNSEILNQAIRRGLVSTPPSHMIGNDESESLPRVNAWVRTTTNANGLFVRPRLFMPYYEELKALVEDHVIQEMEPIIMRQRSRHIADIPDTLYMVEDKPRSDFHNPSIASIPVPDEATMHAMVKREHKLRSSPSCQRAITLPLSSRHEINLQIRLRVVREFNLPDIVADLLENAECYFSAEDDIVGREDETVGEETLPVSQVTNVRRYRTPPRAYLLPPKVMTFPRQLHLHHPHAAAYTSPGSMNEGYLRRRRNALTPESHYLRDAHLSDNMPDVAMATASASLSQLTLQDNSPAGAGELELDLGDGTVPLLRHRQYSPPQRFFI